MLPSYDFHAYQFAQSGMPMDGVMGDEMMTAGNVLYAAQGAPPFYHHGNPHALMMVPPPQQRGGRAMGGLMPSAMLTGQTAGGFRDRDRGGARRREPAPRESNNVLREISNHQRDKGIVCARFFHTGDCSIVNCPYAHLEEHTLKPVPSTQCKFWPEGRCLRDSCPYFHGSTDELKRLRETHQTAYRPVTYMPMRDPMRLLSLEEQELRACDMSRPTAMPGSQPAPSYQQATAQAPMNQLAPQGSYVVRAERAGPPVPVGMEFQAAQMRPGAMPWSPHGPAAAETPPQQFQVVKQATSPAPPPPPPQAPQEPAPAMVGVSVQLPWELLTPEQQRMVLEHQRQNQIR